MIFYPRGLFFWDTVLHEEIKRFGFFDYETIESRTPCRSGRTDHMDHTTRSAGTLTTRTSTVRTSSWDPHRLHP